MLSPSHTNESQARYAVLTLVGKSWKQHGIFEDMDTAKQIAWILRDLRKFSDIKIEPV